MENRETDEKHDLAKWLAGEMNENELASFQNSPEFDDFEKIAQASKDFRTSDFDQNAMLSKILSGEKKVAQPKVVSLYNKNWFRVAAVLLISVGLFFALKPSSEVSKVLASNGELALATLPDQSEVALNSGSEIAFSESTWEEHRQLTLKGEAFFKVAKGKKFDVKTNLGTVTVVGTQFNVKAREQRFEVECYEGKVKVSANGKSQFLTPGQQLVFENGKVPKIAALSDKKPAWTNGELKFESASLEEVLQEFERHFNINIELKTKIDQTVTGRFSGKNLDESIESLCKLYKLQAKTENNVVILSADD
ncbi:FecR family protein [Flavobacterium sp.]|uniref:FecR family protein n=1 Tax=Flavobacterium sp. TaxID=239 RepID=UPI0025B97AFD|nr:FecR domain-containing protein [Flavobacterium sp.]